MLIKGNNIHIPYYVVIFVSKRTNGDNGYAEMGQLMVDLASKQKGFLGIESVRDDESGITFSYWDSLEAIEHWKKHSVHKLAQQKGKEDWYENFSIKVCRVERHSFFEKDRA